MLTVDELRKHVETPLQDDALQRLLDVVEEEIGGYEHTELVSGVGDWLPLSFAPQTVTSVVEHDNETLDTNDYAIVGSVLIRSNDGTHPRRLWSNPVVVTYTAKTNEATRELVAIQLVQLWLNFNPTVTQETIGSWSKQYASNSAYNSSIERANILAQLYSGTVWPR